jgi:hypothetical protein
MVGMLILWTKTGFELSEVCEEGIIDLSRRQTKATVRVDTNYSKGPNYIQYSLSGLDVGIIYTPTHCNWCSNDDGSESRLEDGSR